MMKSKLIVSIITVLCVALLSACVSKSTTATTTSSKEQATTQSKVTVADLKSITLKSTIPLQYVSTETIDFCNGSGNKSNSKALTATASIKVPYIRNYFKDTDNNKYTFDQKNQLIIYESKDLTCTDTNKNAATIKEADIPALLTAYLKSCIINYDDFKILGISDMGEWYDVSMKRTISADLSDNVSISIMKTGKISWFNIGYCGLKSISETQKAQLKKQLDDYLTANRIAGTTTSIASTSYEKVDDKIVGVYSVVYHYSSSSSNSCGPVDCQTYDFNIPA